jgi:hypothetical protein
VLYPHALKTPRMANRNSESLRICRPRGSTE